MSAHVFSLLRRHLNDDSVHQEAKFGICPPLEESQLSVKDLAKTGVLPHHLLGLFLLQRDCLPVREGSAQKYSLPHLDG